LRRVALAAAAAVALLAPSAAVAQTPHVVASANGATARSSANEGEILSCDAAGCTAAITAPARPPATWNGELPASSGTVVEVTFARPVQLVGASVVNRDLAGGGPATVERGADDLHWRVTIGADVPDRAALELRETWTGEDSGKRFTVYRTDYVGLESPAEVLAVKQPRRGGGPVVHLDARSAGLVDIRLKLGKKTLAERSTNLSKPRRGTMAVPLTSSAHRLLARRRRLVPKLSLTFRPASGDPVKFDIRVVLRARPR
jgi:hypothetical protein